MKGNTQESGAVRIAWFAPPESRYSHTASGYLTKVLVPRLRQWFVVDLFTTEPQETKGDTESYHYLTAAAQHRRTPYDLFFYQMEDQRELGFSRIHLGCLPGIVYFHDLLLATDGPEPILNSPWRSTLRRFWDRDAPWPGRTDEHKQPRPHAFREGGYALVPIFSNAKDHNEFQRVVAAAVPERLGRDLPSFCLPYPASLRSPSSAGADQVRRVGILGTPRIESRPHKVLDALSRIPDTEIVWLIDEVERGAAQELLREFGLTSRAELVYPRAPERWAELLPTLGVGIHTLFSVYGQPGPYLHLSLAAGLPCIAMDFGAVPELPSSLVAKVEPGRSESYQIEALLREFLSRPSLPLRERIFEYAAEQFDPEKIAGEMAQIFRAVMPMVKPRLAAWESFERDAAQALALEGQGLGGPQESWLNAWKDLISPTLRALDLGGV